MRSITYSSNALVPFATNDLISLLQKSRKNNAAIGVTGMLLYSDGMFLQTIEGSAEDTERLFQKIRADKRHGEVKILLDQGTSEREFGNWSMGFMEPSGENRPEMEGFTDFIRTPSSHPAFMEGASAAKLMMQFFREKSAPNSPK